MKYNIDLLTYDVEITLLTNDSHNLWYFVSIKTKWYRILDENIQPEATTAAVTEAKAARKLDNSIKKICQIFCQVVVKKNGKRKYKVKCSWFPRRKYMHTGTAKSSGLLIASMMILQGFMEVATNAKGFIAKASTASWMPERRSVTDISKRSEDLFHVYYHL